MSTASTRTREAYTPPRFQETPPRFPELRRALLLANPWVEPWTESFVERTRFLGPGGKGYARGGWLVVAPSACTLPGRGYSWPGSVSDCTVRGVYLHECGHVFHAALGPREEGVLLGLRAVKEPKVTGYEPNPMETFAETFRLFAGNPGLLKAGRPRRFDFLVNAGLLPPQPPRAWELGLLPPPGPHTGRVPQRFFDQCERWIARNPNRQQSLF